MTLFKCNKSDKCEKKDCFHATPHKPNSIDDCSSEIGSCISHEKTICMPTKESPECIKCNDTGRQVKMIHGMYAGEYCDCAKGEEVKKSAQEDQAQVTRDKHPTTLDKMICPNTECGGYFDGHSSDMGSCPHSKPHEKTGEKCGEYFYGGEKICPGCTTQEEPTT